MYRNKVKYLFDKQWIKKKQDVYNDTAWSTRNLIKFHHPSSTYPTYIMRIGVWPTMLKFFDKLSQKLILTAHHKSHQTCKGVKQQPFNQIWLSRNKSKWQTNVYKCNLDIKHSIKAVPLFFHTYFLCISSHPTCSLNFGYAPPQMLKINHIFQ